MRLNLTLCGREALLIRVIILLNILYNLRLIIRTLLKIKPKSMQRTSSLIKLNLYLLKMEAFNRTLPTIYFTRRYFLKRGINKYLFSWRKPTNNSYNLIQDFLTIENQAEVKQLIKILRPFILATKYIKGNTNNPRLKGLYRALQKLIINIELFGQVLIRTQ